MKETFDKGFDSYWGNKGEKWNGKLDIKNYASEIWEAARSYYMDRGIFEPRDMMMRIDVVLKQIPLECRMTCDWNLDEIAGIIDNHYCNSHLCEPKEELPHD